MRSFYRSFQAIEAYFTNTKSMIINYNSVGCNPQQVCLQPNVAILGRGATTSFCQRPANYSRKEFLTSHNGTPPASSSDRVPAQELFQPPKIAFRLQVRCVTTTPNTENPVVEDSSSVISETAKRIKFKRPDKTARHIMQILDKEAVQAVSTQREIPDIKPGHIIQLKVEVPENKRRVSTLKGIVIARRNAGLNTTFRLRRLVAGIGVESVFPLYSPNIKEFKILDKKEVRRAKLYYLRERMNPLRD